MCWQCWRQQGLWVMAGSMQAARSSPQDCCERAHLPCSAGTSLSWWQHSAGRWRALPLPGLSSAGRWTRSLPWTRDSSRQGLGWGCGSVGPAVLHMGQMLCGGQQVYLVLTVGLTCWLLVHRATCRSSSLAFLPGIPHCGFALPLLPSIFNLIF